MASIARPTAGAAWRRSEGMQGRTLPHPRYTGTTAVLCWPAHGKTAACGARPTAATALPTCRKRPEQINALAVTNDGSGNQWLLSDSECLWRSPDGLQWERVPGTAPSLALLATEKGILAAVEEGVTLIA